VGVTANKLRCACRSIADDGSFSRRRKVAAGSATFPPPDRSGAVPPVGHAQSLLTSCPGQPPGSRRWHPGCRRCLLKGCERWFLPERPQARYCSPACQHAARHWRRWHASQRYRATTHGKQRRRDQARRYRSRWQPRATGAEPAPLPPRGVPEPAGVAPEPPPTDPPITSPPAGEGQRPGGIPQRSWGLPCDRPGCYVLFLPTPRSPQQHFCSGRCRRALRRVRQREARHRHRRRRGGRPRRRLQRGPPSATPRMSSRIEKAPRRGLSFLRPQRPRRGRVGRTPRSPVSSLGNRGRWGEAAHG
jgi:hypothetical protein